MAEIAPDQLVYVDRRNNVLKLSPGRVRHGLQAGGGLRREPVVRQIYVYGNSARSYLLAVVVPTDGRTGRVGETSRRSSRCSASAAEHRQGRRAAVLRDPARLHRRDDPVHARRTACSPVSASWPGPSSSERYGPDSSSSTSTWPTARRTCCRRCATTARTGRCWRRSPGPRCAARRGLDRRGARRGLHRPGRRLAVGVDLRQPAARHLRRRGAGRRHRQPGQRPAAHRRLHRGAAVGPAPSGRPTPPCTAATRPRCTPAT